MNELQANKASSLTNMVRLDESLFSEDKAPYYMSLAEKLSRTSMIPKAYIGKPMDLFVAMAMGFSLGLSIEQSIQDIAVINGKPTLYGDGLLAVCMNNPEFEDILEEPMKDGDKIIGYRCTIKRRGRSPCVREFTLSDAKRACLLGKSGPWSLYESRMLSLRARSFALRDSFADALRGVKSREEVEDYIDGEIITAPASRTELLKQAIIQGEANETAENMVVQSANKETDALHTNLPEEACVPPARKQAALASRGDTAPATITDEQLDALSSMIAEGTIDADRLTRAFAFFAVSTLEELSENHASRFIELLNKNN